MPKPSQVIPKEVHSELLSEEAFLAKTDKEYKERLAKMTYAELLGQIFLEALGVGGSEIYDSEHNLAYQKYKEDYYKKKQGHNEQQFLERLAPLEK